MSALPLAAVRGPKKTWIVVANRSNAKLFERRSPRGKLESIQDFSHPRGRLKNREIDSDRSGRSFERMGQGGHAMSREQSAGEHEAEVFAKALAAALNGAAHEHGFEHLILVAEPHMLGLLRSHLDDQTLEKIETQLSKNLVDMGVDVLEKLLSGSEFA